MQNVTQILMAGPGVIDLCRVLSLVGVRATRTEVLEALRQQDPSAVIARQERILHRRTYDVRDAMALWHIDSRLCFS